MNPLFPICTLLVIFAGLRLEQFIVVEWTLNYGDDRLYRNVTIA